MQGHDPGYCYLYVRFGEPYTVTIVKITVQYKPKQYKSMTFTLMLAFMMF